MLGISNANTSFQEHWMRMMYRNSFIHKQKQEQEQEQEQNFLQLFILNNKSKWM